MKPASVSTRSTSWSLAGTDATKLSVPVVSAVPLVPPAIAWSIFVRSMDCVASPTLRDAETPVGTFSVPESSVAWVTERVKETNR